MLSEFALQTLVAAGVCPPGTQAEAVTLGVTAPAADARANFEAVLSQKLRRPVSLAHVPPAEWAAF